MVNHIELICGQIIAKTQKLTFDLLDHKKLHVDKLKRYYIYNWIF